MKILITGSTQGIGKALAQAFVERGDEVIVHGSHSMEKVERVRAEIGAAQAVVCDLSDLKETKELFKKTGEIDCLIINASVQYKTPWHEIKDEEMETQLTVNFKSTLKLMQKRCGENVKDIYLYDMRRELYRKCGKSIRKGDKLYRIFVQLV